MSNEAASARSEMSNKERKALLERSSGRGRGQHLRGLAAPSLNSPITACRSRVALIALARLLEKASLDERPPGTAARAPRA